MYAEGDGKDSLAIDSGDKDGAKCYANATHATNQPRPARKDQPVRPAGQGALISAPCIPLRSAVPAALAASLQSSKHVGLTRDREAALPS